MWRFNSITTGGQNRYGLVLSLLINPPELPINHETRNDTNIASAGVQLCYRTPRVANSKTKTWNKVMHQKVRQIKQVEIG